MLFITPYELIYYFSNNSIIFIAVIETQLTVLTPFGELGALLMPHVELPCGANNRYKNVS